MAGCATFDPRSSGPRVVASLTAQELLDVAETCHATGLFASRLAAWRGRHLAELRDALDPAAELRERISRSIDDAGEVLDTASPELASIRRRLRTAQDRVRERLNAMLRSSDVAGVIGEPIVTVRAGRYVIPIRADAKGRLKGIVHDQSASGATLFIEPLSVVELNNTWIEATLAEQREVERILEELSRRGGGACVFARATRCRPWPPPTCGWPAPVSPQRWTPSNPT